MRYLTYRFRLKDKHSARLERLARAVAKVGAALHTAVPLPEPEGVLVVGTQALRGFTAEQLLAYGDRRAAEAVERCIAAAEAERLDQPELAEDIAYEQAITDVISAIRKGA